MGAISEHRIGTHNGSMPILEWVKDHKFRNYANFGLEQQLDMAKKIAELEDNVARELLLKQLSLATYLQEKCEEMHKEFDTLYAALSKIEDDEGEIKLQPKMIAPEDRKPIRIATDGGFDKAVDCAWRQALAVFGCDEDGHLLNVEGSDRSWDSLLVKFISLERCGGIGGRCDYYLFEAWITK